MAWSEVHRAAMNTPASPCWPRPGHENCSCTIGYGPSASLAIRLRELEERVADLEAEMGRLRVAVGQPRLATSPQEVPYGRC